MMPSQGALPSSKQRWSAKSKTRGSARVAEFGVDEAAAENDACFWGAAAEAAAMRNAP
jgi:hypothetical protein